MLPNLLKDGEPFFFPGGSVGCLLVHGFVSAPQEMRWLGERLSAADFTVLGVRLYGHATQASDLYRVRWRDWIASIEDGYNFIRDQCEKIVVVGMSLGGALALVSSASLHFDCAVTISAPYQTIPYAKLSFLRATFPILGISQFLVRSLPKPPPMDFLDQQAAKDHLTYSVFPTRGVLETDHLLTQMRRALPQITIPVLVIHSRQDRGVPIDNAEKLINALGSHKLETLFIENSGHVVLLEPERQHAANVIIEFILNTTRLQQ
jgi:carboxylesterase